MDGKLVETVGILSLLFSLLLLVVVDAELDKTSRKRGRGTEKNIINTVDGFLEPT